jgi:DNA end-binding protein Ku
MAATRVSLLPHDPHTGAEIERGEVVKGYEYERGGFVTFTADERKALDVESSKIIELESFVPRSEVDPYLVHPVAPIQTARSGLRLAADRGGDGRSLRCWHRPRHP